MFRVHTLSRKAHRSAASRLSLMLAAATSLAGLAEAHQCNNFDRWDDGALAPNLPPLAVPFDFGEDWRVGAGGAFFGEGWHCNHHNDYYATDWNRANDAGEAVYPVASGVVTKADCGTTNSPNNGGFGCLVHVEHRLGNDHHRFTSRYAHLGDGSLDHLRVGEPVTAWTKIGEVGATGQQNMAAHLHLGLQSYSAGAWISRCSSLAKGETHCASSELPSAPQSKKPRWMWQDLSDVTVSRAGLHNTNDAGALISSGNRPRIFLPGFLKDNGTWDTNFYIRNNDGASQDIRWDVYDENGAWVHGNEQSVAADGTWQVSPSVNTLGQAVLGGTLVVHGESGQDMVAVARVERKNSSLGRAFAAYEGVEQPLVKQQVAVFHRYNHGWNSRVFIFNPDAGSSIEVKILYADPNNGCNQDPITVGPLETYELDGRNVAWACVPNRHTALTVEAYYDGQAIGGLESPAVVALTSIQERYVGSQIDSLAAVATRDLGQTVYVPLIQNENYDIQAGLGIHKVSSGTGGVDVRYLEENGDHCLTDSSSNLPFIRTPVPVADASSCDSVMSARVTGTGSADYLSGQFNQLLGAQSSSFPSVASPGYDAYLPYFDTASGVVKGIQIQNTSGQQITGTLSFYRGNGSHISGWNRTITLDANALETLVGSSVIPNAARSAKLEMDGPVAVIMNNVKDSGSDPLMTYTAPGRH